MKKVSRINMDEVSDIIYGKKSKVMMKKYNESLEPWLCFSIVLKKRTLDFYCPKNTVK